MPLSAQFLKFYIVFIYLMCPMPARLFSQQLQLVEYNEVISGADQTNLYFPMLKGKRVAIVTNQTGIVGASHLVDTLHRSGIRIAKIFTPEHGFRGDHDAGAFVATSKDPKTGIEIVSLYGKKKKPEAADLLDVDIVLFDLQDVGVRFYTYISTLTYIMEACAENNKLMIVLDRPNPNGYFIDGPVLKPKLKSFVGLHPVPVVYGLTIGEYAQMVNGEKWLECRAQCSLIVVKLKGYERNKIVKLPIKPSPNLPNWESVYLYPSLCFFEGTVVSIGRGTLFPFQVFGHPDFKPSEFSFVPHPVKGASSKPPLEGQTCYGINLQQYAHSFNKNPKKINLKWLSEAYQQLNGKQFFNNYFNVLAGNDTLRKQIEAEMDCEKIALSWKDEIDAYKKIRVKYLLYPDFLKSEKNH